MTSLGFSLDLQGLKSVKASSKLRLSFNSPNHVVSNAQLHRIMTGKTEEEMGHEKKDRSQCGWVAI
jgi:hypothetical protein